MKIARIAALLAALLVAAAGCGDSRETGTEGEDGLRVVASFYPMYDFASKIAGDQANVTCLVPPGTEAHDWEPSVQDRILLEEADVFVYNGLGMEHWTESVLGSLENGNLVVVEAAGGVELLTSGGHDHDGEGEEDHQEEDDHEGGHSHDGVDPHVWLSPRNAGLQMEAIRDGLVEADPANRETYEANYQKWAEELDKLDREFRQALEPIENRYILVSHRAFGYLCDAYGLVQVAVMSYSPDGEPDPAHMAEIVDFARDHGIATVFYEADGSGKVAAAVAAEFGGGTAMLNPLESLSATRMEAGDDYFSVMRENLEALVKALEG